MDTTASEILKYLCKSGTINIGDVKKAMKAEYIENIIEENHPYPIWQGGGRWKTYIYDESRPNHRRQISRNRREDLLEVVCREYAAASPTLRTVFDDWIIYKGKRVADNTIVRIRTDWNRYYDRSKIVDVPLAELSDMMIEAWILEILKNPMTKTAYYNMTLIIKGILEYAVRTGLIETSPYDTVDISLRNHLKPPREKGDDEQVFTPEEICQFEALALEDFYEAGRKVYRLAPLAALFAFYTGLRVGELTGLRHEDITKTDIYIRRFVRREDHKIMDRTKTRAGIRQVPLTDAGKRILDMVAQFKNTTNPEGFVFSEYDRPLPSRIVEGYFQKYCEKIGTAHKSTHCARKTYVSTLIDSNVNINTVRKAVGHADERTTYRSYVFDRSTPAEQRNQFNNALNFRHATIKQRNATK